MATLLQLPTGTDRRRAIALIAAAGLGFALAPGASAAAPFDFGALMKLLAQTRSGEATFVERREVAMLDRTMVSSGRLTFAAPDTFVRETLRPLRERIEVVGNRATFTQGGRTRTMELDASPEAAVIVEAIRGTLTGNREALERLFEIAVTGSAERWSLELLPRDARLRGQVAAVTMKGEQALVREVRVLLADGDRSVMTIEPTAAAAPRPASAAAPASAPRPDVRR